MNLEPTATAPTPGAPAADAPTTAAAPGPSGAPAPVPIAPAAARAEAAAAEVPGHTLGSALRRAAVAAGIDLAFLEALPEELRAEVGRA